MVKIKRWEWNCNSLVSSAEYIIILFYDRFVALSLQVTVLYHEWSDWVPCLNGPSCSYLVVGKLQCENKINPSPVFVLILELLSLCNKMIWLLIHFGLLNAICTRGACICAFPSCWLVNAGWDSPFEPEQDNTCVGSVHFCLYHRIVLYVLVVSSKILLRDIWINLRMISLNREIFSLPYLRIFPCSFFLCLLNSMNPLQCLLLQWMSIVRICFLRDIDTELALSGGVVLLFSCFIANCWYEQAPGVLGPSFPVHGVSDWFRLRKSLWTWTG